MVIPDGAPLGSGAPLAWSDVGNLTMLVVLPNITRPDAITYVVLSAMGDDRTIFQVAAGVWPGSPYWSVYSWYVSGVDTQAPTYQWIANSTGPRFSPGDEVTVSLLRSSSGWGFCVYDHATGASQTGSFPADRGVTFASGDQEVLALESYSRSSATFVGMGNLTLETLLVDGAQVQGGWYFYSGWDPAHNPLFLVGGSQAPLFISLTTNSRGEVVWGYSTQWADAHVSIPPGPLLPGLAVIGLATVGIIAMARKVRRAPTH